MCVSAGAGGPLLPYGGTFRVIVHSEQVHRRHLGIATGLHESLLACLRTPKLILHMNLK